MVVAGYEGATNTSSGVREGFGVQHYSNGDEYHGTWLADKPHGTGTYRYSSGAQYEGQFAEGQRHGRGKYVFASGDVYDGEWRGGKRTGRGKLRVVSRTAQDGTYVEGYEFTGSFVDGKKTGVGKMTYATGDVYEGEFRDDARHGQGTLKMANGDCFTGKFDGDAIHGFGTFYSASRDRLFSAFFVNGRVTQQVCGAGGDAGEPCIFNRGGACVRCASPSLAAILDEQDDSGSRGSGSSRSNSIGLSPTNRWGFAPIDPQLPTTTAAAIRRARELLAASTAQLGVQVGESKGFVRVLAVKDNSTAWQVGLQRGQYILSINGVPIRSSDAVVNLCSKMDIGQRGVITVCERDDPPTSGEPQRPTTLGFYIGGNLHIKEVEFLQKVATVEQPVSDKTLASLDRVQLRVDPICIPVQFQLLQAQKEQRERANAAN